MGRGWRLDFGVGAIDSVGRRGTGAVVFVGSERGGLFGGVAGDDEEQEKREGSEACDGAAANNRILGRVLCGGQPEAGAGYLI